MRRLLPLLSVVFALEASLYACIVPLLPHYVREFALTKVGAGLLTGAYPIGVVSGAIVVWRIRDVNPRFVTSIGLVILGSASLMFGFSSNIGLLDATRILQGVGCGGIWGGGLGWLTGATTTADRGRAFGYVFGAATFGTMLGPVFGTLATEVSTRVVFGGIGLLGGGLAIVVLRTSAPSAAGLPGASNSRELCLASLMYGLTVIIVTISALGALTVLVPLRITHLGGTNIEVGATFLAASAIATLVSPLAGRLSDRKGRFWPIQIGIISGAACLVGLSWASNPVVVIVVAIGYLGWSFNLIASPVLAFISDVTESTRWESAVPTIVLVAFAGGELVGSIGGSSLATITSDAVSYRVLAFAGLATLVALHASKSMTAEDLGQIT